MRVHSVYAHHDAGLRLCLSVPNKNWMSHTIEILIILQYETHQNTIYANDLPLFSWAERLRGTFNFSIQQNSFFFVRSRSRSLSQTNTSRASPYCDDGDRRLSLMESWWCCRFAEMCCNRKSLNADGLATGQLRAHSRDARASEMAKVIVAFIQILLNLQNYLDLVLF